MSQQGLLLVHTEKLKPIGPISEKLVSSDISHVAFASVLLGENPSEEVDDYDNFYYCYMNLSQETTIFGGRQKLTSAMKQSQKSDGRLQNCCSIQLSLHKEHPEVGLVKKLTGSLY